MTRDGGGGPGPGSLSRCPRVGLTMGHDMPDRPELLRLPRAYVDAIVAAGGIPIVVPPTDLSAVEAISSTLDGLLLTGGVDVHPARYGTAADGRLRVDNDLDRIELELVRQLLSDRRPVLGICRGQQLVNVALGGTLVQDLPSEGKHHSRDGHSGWIDHPIEVDGESRLAQLLGTTHLTVNSYHHQAIRQLGRGLRAAAWAPDGVIEGVESEEHDWLVAVQFHPERLVPTHEPSRRLFAAFVEAAAGGARV